MQETHIDEIVSKVVLLPLCLYMNTPDLEWDFSDSTCACLGLAMDGAFSPPGSFIRSAHQG